MRLESLHEDSVIFSTRRQREGSTRDRAVDPSRIRRQASDERSIHKSADYREGDDEEAVIPTTRTLPPREWARRKGWLSGGLLIAGVILRSIAFTEPGEWFIPFLLWNLRVGALWSDWDLEKVLNQYQVDLVLSGHTHIYERTHPVFHAQADASSLVPRSLESQPLVYAGGGHTCLRYLWVWLSRQRRPLGQTT